MLVFRVFLEGKSPFSFARNRRKNQMVKKKAMSQLEVYGTEVKEEEKNENNGRKDL